MSSLQRLAAANSRATATIVSPPKGSAGGGGGEAPGFGHGGLHINKPAAETPLATAATPAPGAGTGLGKPAATPFAMATLRVPGTPGVSKSIPKKVGVDITNLHKKPQQIFAAIEGLAEYKSDMRGDKAFLLALLAGAYIALGGAVSVMWGGGVPATQHDDPGLQKFMYAALFPFGIILVVILGGELVTSNMSIMPAGALAQRVSAWAVARNWIVSYIGNLLGSLFVAAVLMHASGLDAAGPRTAFLHAMAAKKVHATFLQNFVKGIGCNWMVCAGYWSAMAAEDIIGKIVALWFPIAAFVTIGFEHSVANMFLIPAGMMAGADVTVGEFIVHNLIPVTLGNVIGGLLLALPYWYVYWLPSHPVQLPAWSKKALLPSTAKDAATTTATGGSVFASLFTKGTATSAGAPAATTATHQQADGCGCGGKCGQSAASAPPAPSATGCCGDTAGTCTKCHATGNAMRYASALRCGGGDGGPGAVVVAPNPLGVPAGPVGTGCGGVQVQQIELADMSRGQVQVDV